MSSFQWGAQQKTQDHNHRNIGAENAATQTENIPKHLRLEAISSILRFLRQLNINTMHIQTIYAREKGERKNIDTRCG